MKKWTVCFWTSFVLIIMSSAVCFPAADTGLDKSGNAAKRVSDSVLSYFTSMHGVVEGVENDHIAVKLNNEAAVKKGMRFAVFREGAPFYHPVTKEQIGKSEDRVGTIEVEEVSENGLHKCRIINGSVQSGDLARITSSKIKLAFFQDRKANWAISELFYNTLKNSERFDILEAYTSSYETEHLSGLARGLGADAVLMFSTPFKDGNKLLNAKLFWVNDNSIFADISDVAGTDIDEMIKPYERFLVAAGSGLEPWGSYHLGNGYLVAIGNVDGLGEKEIVVSDGNILRIYSLRDELQEIWQIKGANWEKHLSIDIMDVNGNGVAEIFVTNMIDSDNTDALINDSHTDTPSSVRQRISSYVIEYDPSSGYRRIADNVPYFFSKAGSTLLLQEYSLNKGFAPPVYQAQWKEGQYKPGRALQLADNVNLYGFTYIDWQHNGQKYLVSFDDNGFLTMYDGQQNAVWKSKKSFGEFEMTFEKKTSGTINLMKKWSVRGSLFPVTTDRGQEVIVVKRVPFVEQVPGLGAKEAEVYSLWWDGTAMQEQLVLSDISGTITDYLIEGTSLFLLARGNMLSLAKNAISGDFVKGSVLYYYSFGKK
jgi:hypothetical protein